MSFFKRIILAFSLLIALILCAWFLFTAPLLKNKLIAVYNAKQSAVIYDRNGNIIAVKTNRSGNFAQNSDEVPPLFKELLLKKEDKYFYFHRGINPVSALRAFTNHSMGNKNVSSSTITQQLVKILLGNENERSIKNKLVESVYALSLETFLSKDEILKMYVNSAYFGNKAEGLNEASRLYFGASPSFLSKEEILQLLSAINSPSISNPFLIQNASVSNELAKRLGMSAEKIISPTTGEIETKIKNFSSYVNGLNRFEIESLGINCKETCHLTIDSELSSKIREIVRRNLLSSSDKKVSNGAVVAIKLPENELLAIIGSPDPRFQDFGYQINMAKEPRPIGSTIKPFIYLKAFEKGMRPYTLVDDREYKYMIGSGFPLYPKNYDYQYHGTVNLHYALSNSLNVPSVIVLENVGLNNFYSFLLSDLGFKPVQEVENYQLGIALGELETDLLSLSYHFTVFPNNGALKPLKIYQNKNDYDYGIKTDFSLKKIIADRRYAELVNKILSDRKTGAEQFGLNSSLNLPFKNYAVKTGTSREFHDSWTIGYTPDFLVGVWIGNSDNTAMDNVSGQSGAGLIWNEIMSLMMNSKYSKNTPFDFKNVEYFYENESAEYGLKGDDYEEQKMMLMKNGLILNPHENDVFLLEENTQIPLTASENAEWKVNGKFIGEGNKIIFSPRALGKYEIEATSPESGKTEIINITLEKE